MEGIAEKLRELAYRLCSNESPEQKWSSSTSFWRVATKIHMAAASDLRLFPSHSQAEMQAMDRKNENCQVLLLMTKLIAVWLWIELMKKTKPVFRRSIADIFRLFLRSGTGNPPGNMTGNSMNEEIRSDAFSCKSSASAEFSLTMTSGISYSQDSFYLPWSQM